MYDVIYIGTNTKNYNTHLKNIPVIKRAKDFDHAKKICLTKFFYAIWDDIKVDYNFDYTVDDYSTGYTHVFKNGKHYDGVCLFPKDVKVSQEEVYNRLFANKKEVDIQASTPNPFDILYCSSYDDYLEQRENVKSDFFYVVPKDIDLCKDFKFDYQPALWERDVIATFKNGDYNDGVFLQHKSVKLARREFEFCWFPKTNEVDIQASTPKPYDIVFISYNEPNAEDNFKRLQQRFPRAKRVDGVKGIHQAHIAAAKLCDTEMFWVVDGDAQIVDDFDFDYQVPKWKKDQVFVWHTQNPLNGLIYGYGGVKLFPRKETLNMDTTKPDMTTSISTKFNSVKEVSNITAFNTDPFNTWKSAFRECVKLSSKIIDRQEDDETEKRLFIWCKLGRDGEFGEFAISGACAGREYGTANKDNPDALKLINDFDWLKEKFKEA